MLRLENITPDGNYVIDSWKALLDCKTSMGRGMISICISVSLPRLGGLELYHGLMVIATVLPIRIVVRMTILDSNRVPNADRL